MNLASRATAITDRMGNSLTGILCLVTGIFVFSLQDLIIKLLSGTYTVHELLVFRSLGALPFFVWLAHLDGGLRDLLTPRWPALLGRGGVLFFSHTFYYMGIAALPLATNVTLNLTAPLFITILAALVLKEKVAVRRWSAIIAGFIGVLIIVQPGSGVFDWASVLPICSGLTYAVTQMFTRVLGVREKATTLAFYGNLAFLLGALISGALFASGAFATGTHKSLGFLLRAWTWPSERDLLLMMLCALVAVAGMLLLTQAYRVAPPPVVAAFEYTSLIWSVLYGYLIWHELPSPTTWLGILVIVCAGLYVIHRERQLKIARDRAKDAV